MIWRIISILLILINAGLFFQVRITSSEVVELKKRIELLVIRESHEKKPNNRRVIKPKFLGIVLNGRIHKCDSMYPPAIPFEGKFYDMWHGYAISKEDSGRLIHNGKTRTVVYPGDPRYYKGHEDSEF